MVFVLYEKVRSCCPHLHPMFEEEFRLHVGKNVIMLFELIPDVYIRLIRLEQLESAPSYVTLVQP